MKKSKAFKYIVVCSLVANVLLNGCGVQTMQQKESQMVGNIDIPEADVESVTDKKMSEDFYFIIEDAFALQDRNDLVVVGYNLNSEMHAGAEVDILSADGRIQTQILSIEQFDAGIVESVEVASNVGVMLSGVTREQVKPGDMLVLRDQGVIGSEIQAMVSMLPVAELEYVEFSEMQSVNVVFYEEQIETTAVSAEVTSEEWDDGVTYIQLELAKPVAYINHQIFYLMDEDGNMIAVGCTVSE